MAKPTTKQEVDRLRKQLSVLAEFGRHALRTTDLDELLQEATALVSEALEVDLVKVLELLPDGDTMLLRAGVNWNPGVVGHATFGAHARSPGGYALQTDEPVISENVDEEKRFEIPEVLVEHGVKSMVNVVIRTDGHAFGVLEVGSRRPRKFDHDDISFLQNYAHLVGSAVERLDSHRELASAAQTRHVLLQEVQHRLRNMLANIRALARRTRAGSASLDDFVSTLDSRLAALARTHELLSRREEGETSIREILQQELTAHGAQEGEHFTQQGPNTIVPHKIAQALAMAFHELATNAAKHGALRVDGGVVEISWRVDPSDDGNLVSIRWRERGVEIKSEPYKKGYGSEIIDKAVPYMVAGKSRRIFHPDGIECVIQFPLTGGRIVAAEPASPERSRLSKPLEGLRILVVEDEFLVAAEIVELLRGLGAEVLGPVGRLKAAQQLLQQQTTHGAILDVRLDGEMSFPLADELLARRVPVIFTTGLEAQNLPEKYLRLPYLRKPVDHRALEQLAKALFRAAA